MPRYKGLFGESIASEGKGGNMYVGGRVLTSSGEPIPVIETWETDDKGEEQHSIPSVLPTFFSAHGSCVSSSYARLLRHSLQGTPRTRLPSGLRTDEQGRHRYRAIVPVAYSIPDDVGFIFLLFWAISCPFGAHVMCWCSSVILTQNRALWVSSF